MLGEHEFDQIMAEANAKLGQANLLPFLELMARRYGWPIPADAREAVVSELRVFILRKGWVDKFAP
jgi:hypothetical protein